MAEDNYSNDGNKRVDRRLSLPEYGDQDRNTIYKLTLSMKRRLSPQESMDTPSPVEAGEVGNLLHRLVEIDNESRKLLCKVFKLLEKDETLEAYVKERIEDPKVSKMWELVEQVLAQQDMELNLNDYDKYITNDRSIKEKDEKDKEKANDRFKVKNIGSGNEPAGNSRATAGATTSTTAAATSSSSSTTRGSK